MTIKEIVAYPAYEGMLGSYKLLKDGDTQHSDDFYIMTKQQFEDIKDELRLRYRTIKEARNAKELAEEKAKTATEKAKRDANYELEQHKKEAEDAVKDKLDEAENRADYAEQELNKQVALNNNLLRINRERSNADRKLQPKKKHTGYVVMVSRQREVRYKDGNGNSKPPVTVWETTIQTPFNADYDLYSVQKFVLRDLWTPNFLIDEIGIDAYFSDEIYKLFGNDDYANQNVAFKQQFSLNFKTGYWEVTYTHTLPLGPVPREMRACG